MTTSKSLITIFAAAMAATAASACDQCAPDLWNGPMGVYRVGHKGNVGHYQTASQESPDCNIWFQVDLGSAKNIDEVMVYPTVFDGWDVYQRHNYPARFKIEASNDFNFKTSTVIVDKTGEDQVYDIIEKIDVFKPAAPVKARYVRFTATKLNNFINKYHNDPTYRMQLWRFEVISGGKIASENRPLYDSISGHLGKHSLLRPRRPEGEGAIRDYPENVTDPATWQAVDLKLDVPKTGVTLGENSLFKTVMERNAQYLLSSFTVDDVLIEFRDRAGKPHGTNSRGLNNEWVNILPSSAAGRYLMGAGNHVRWLENEQLSQNINAIVDGIEECAEDNGYILGYPENKIFYFENGAYCRAWLTHGLLEAHYAGNTKALPMLRKFYDWFNASPYLSELQRRSGQGRQGVIASARMAASEVGKPADIHTIQRHYQENFWLDQLTKRDPDAIFGYPYDRPHCYLLVSMETFMDMYFVTGDKKYLDADLGAWDIWTEYYQHIGGTISISENGYFPPKSYYIHNRTGELCGNVFWIFFNQRLHRLFPDEEKYVFQIEQSIYNSGIACQDESGKIRYHAKLAGYKEGGQDTNTCCEGQGTRLYGALPEFIYTLADDGVYVNLYEPSSISWEQNGKQMGLAMETEFPKNNDVKLTVSTDTPNNANIRVRVPQWAASNVTINVNGSPAATSVPGKIVSLNRQWSDGDTITFTLPVELKARKYTGQEPTFQDADRNTHAIEYGPFLLALTGPTLTDNGFASMNFPISKLKEKLKPVAGNPAHFTVDGMEDTLLFKPYHEVQGEKMTCFQFYEAETN